MLSDKVETGNPVSENVVVLRQEAELATGVGRDPGRNGETDDLLREDEFHRLETGEAHQVVRRGVDTSLSAGKNRFVVEPLPVRLEAAEVADDQGEDTDVLDDIGVRLPLAKVAAVFANLDWATGEGLMQVLRSDGDGPGEAFLCLGNEL